MKWAAARNKFRPAILALEPSFREEIERYLRSESFRELAEEIEEHEDPEGDIVEDFAYWLAD